MSSDVWLSDKETAFKLGVSLRTLQNWRSTQPDRLPPATNLGSPGGRPMWRFKQSDIEKFMEIRQVRLRKPKGETDPREQISKDKAEMKAIQSQSLK